MSDCVLYSYFRSSAAYRVRIGLHLKNIPFEYKAVHLVRDGGEQLKDDYKKLNPMGEVPSFVHKGHVIGQSMAILEYIDQLWPNPKIFPADPYERAQVVQICESINSGIHPVQNLKVLKELERRYQVDEPGRKAWAQLWIMKGFEALEKMLATKSNKFCFGNNVSAADLFLIPQMFNARRYECDLQKFPTLVKIDQNCQQLEAFQKAHPERQPDFAK